MVRKESPACSCGAGCLGALDQHRRNRSRIGGRFGGNGNGRQAGGGQQLCPTALINDGLLQLRIFTGEELLPGLLSALTQSEDNPNIIEGASSWFDIRAPHEITFNLDGEPLSGQEFHIEILPAALRCRLPPGCPLLR